MTDPSEVTEADPSVEYRRYEPGEKNAVWAVHDRAFRASRVEMYPELDRYLRRIPAFYLESGGGFLVATVPTREVDPGVGHDRAYGRAGEVVVGMGGFLPSTAEESSVRPDAPVDPGPETVEVRSVRVDPDFQRLGVGRALMGELESRASDRGFRRVVLDTGVDLVAAQRLYESLGYDRVGREEYFGFELIYYEKDL